MERYRNSWDLLQFINTCDPQQQLSPGSSKVIFVTLFNCLKNEKLDPAEKKRILESDGMQKLCGAVKENCRNLFPEDLITICKLFAHLNAPANHPTFHMVLRHLSKHANLSKAATLALPVIFEGQLSEQLENKTLWELVDSLYSAIQNNHSKSVLTKIIKPIVKKQIHLNNKQAKSIVWSLGRSHCQMYSLESAELLEISFKVLARNIPSLDMKQLNVLLEFCANRSLNPILDACYNEDFVETACNRIIKAHQKADKQLVHSCFKYISTARQVNIELIETVADLIASNPNAILKWNSSQPFLLEHPNPAVCKKSTATGTLDRWLKKTGTSTLILIHEAVKNRYPEYSGPMPSPSVVKAWRVTHRSSKEASKKNLILFERALITAFGGESYFMSGILHEGIYIDHCVVMRQGGFPISVQDRHPRNLEGITRPTNSFLILIKVSKGEADTSSAKKLRGFHSLESKILAGFGHSVLEVNLWDWTKLKQSEQIPWLMRKIREHTGQAPSSFSHF